MPGGGAQYSVVVEKSDLALDDLAAAGVPERSLEAVRLLSRNLFRDHAVPERLADAAAPSSHLS